MSKTEATTKLDKAYVATRVPVYFSDSDEVAVQPTLGNLGYTIDNSAHVDAYSYPFLARLVPYSLFWYQFFMSKGNPEVARSDEALSRYIVERFGEDCEFAPVNGTVAYIDDELQAVEASRGGSCDSEEMQLAFEVEDKEQTIPAKTVEPWIEYAVVEGELVAGVNDEKAAAWLSEKYGKKYTWDAGTTTIH